MTTRALLQSFAFRLATYEAGMPTLLTDADLCSAGGMAKPLLVVLTGVLVFVVLTAESSSCGGSTPSSGVSPENTPGATPNAAANVNCSGSGGPSSGTLTGLGATIGQFRTAHPQDPKYTSQFGATISGGPNNGLPELTAFCSTGGVVVSVTQNFNQSMTDSQVKASLISPGIAPADSQFQSAKTLGACEIFYYQSALISSDPGANDTAGTFLVELQPPGSSAWDPTNVTTLVYDLDESGGC
jgi:hypothetical protein